MPISNSSIVKVALSLLFVFLSTQGKEDYACR